MILAGVILLGGVVLLYLGAEWLIRGAAELGVRLGLRPLVIGLTIVSIGTSAPEFVVCVLAVLQGSPDIVMGNVLGSNLANVGLILGIGALVSPLAVSPRVVQRDIPWMLGVSVLAVPLLWNLHVGRAEGAVLIGLLVVYMLTLVPNARSEGKAVLDEVSSDHRQSAEAGSLRKRPAPGEGLRHLLVPLSLIVVGSLALVGGGQGIVRGAATLARDLGISELVIGLSVVALGTSLPELATTIVAAMRREADMAVGNIVGSNTFNLTFVLGGTALVQPFPLTDQILAVELPATLLVSVLLLPLAVHQLRLGRLKGLLLLGAYAGIWVWIQLAP